MGFNSAFKGLMKFEFSWQIFEKILKYKISWKFHPVGAELFHVGGWTDRHDEAKSRSSQFCQRA